MTYDIAAPEPAGMVASLSSLGYSLPAAVADLVDNSVSAGARNIDVTFTWAGRDSWIAVVDDGRGMSAEELVTAMTVAARGPKTKRSSTDLGRFGVGLKSASFSQARQLSVAAATAGECTYEPGTSTLSRTPANGGCFTARTKPRPPCWTGFGVAPTTAPSCSGDGSTATTLMTSARTMNGFRRSSTLRWRVPNHTWEWSSPASSAEVGAETCKCPEPQWSPGIRS